MGQGRQVSFKNTIIIMTSNVGSKAIADLSGKDREEMRHQVDAAMAETFAEFLNRIDNIVVFHPLGMAQIEKIVDIQLADVRARLAKERMTLAITPAAKQMLAVGGLSPCSVPVGSSAWFSARSWTPSPPPSSTVRCARAIR